MNEWQIDAVKLAETGVMSWRDIARTIKKPRSTVSDFLRSYYKWRNEDISEVVEETPLRIQTNISAEGPVHLFIPDLQVKKGVDLSYLDWIGKYAARKRPDVIVLAGDVADVESLSSYNKGKRAAEGKRFQEDVDATKKAMQRLLKPIHDLQEKEMIRGKVDYKPRLVITLGNHEDRVDRYVNDHPELHGFLSTDCLGFAEMGFEVYPFLTPVIIGGIAYCHYFPNVMTGKPLSGTASNMIKTIGNSFTMGHKQTLDVTTRFLPADGRQQWGLVAGACYLHDEDYKGKQGNHHWRGVVVKHNVKNGSYDPLFVSLDWLREEYGT